ncbi:MAG TPA: hypothetical protein VFX45_05840 [Solirubrobacterales bacterium]|nr:hypothetical protein [Solirubrobacterales bacterium]
MIKPPPNLNPRRLRERERPLAETVREHVAEAGSPVELARELGEPLSVIAFHWLREGPGQESGAESAA